MDGTLVDTYSRAINQINLLKNTNFQLSDMKSYAMTELGVTEDDLVKVYATPKLHEEAEPFPLALESIKSLREVGGFQIHLATARKRVIQQETLNWIARHNVSFDSFHLIDNTYLVDPLSKVRLVKKFNIGLAVDDAPVYINSLADHCDTVFAIETDYNKRDIKNKPNIVRVQSVAEMAWIIASAYGWDREGRPNETKR
jgi:uncharacterized HAD superfamily protein